MRSVTTGVLLFIVILMPARHATGQVRAVSLEELSQTSTSIVLGKTAEKRSFWNEDRSQILTEITVRVDESLKGSSESEAVITVPGGRVGNVIYEVSDMPVFVDGEEVLVFLWEHPTGATLVNGGPQGKLEIVADDVTGRKRLRGVPRGEVATLAKAGATQLAPEAPAGSIPLDAVVAQIKAYAGGD